MTEETFSPEQSLQVIQSMIEKSKQDFSGNSFYLIFWGWLIFISALGQYFLKVVVNYPSNYVIWNLMWVGMIGTVIYGFRTERKRTVKTYMNDTMKFFGMGTGITFMILAFIIACFKMWEHAFPIYFLLYGFMSFISGAILRYAPLRWAGAFCWAIAIASVFASFDMQLLLMALAVLVAYVIPGYLLQNRYKNQSK